MPTLHVIEERKAGAWTFYRLAKNADDATKGVAAMKLANPEWEVRAAEYVRAKDLWLDVEIQNGAGTWVAVECAYTDEAELLASMEAERHLYLSAYRVVRVVRGEARHVVETFAPKGGA